MDTEMNKWTDIFLLMVLVLILGACGTLKIDAELTASQIEPATRANPITGATPTQAAVICRRASLACECFLSKSP